MKTALIFVANPFVTKNLIHSGVVARLLKSEDTRLVILVPEFRADAMRAQFKDSERVAVEPIAAEVLVNRLDFIYQFFMQNSLATDTVRIKQYHALLDGSRLTLLLRLPAFLFKRLLWYLGKWRGFKRAVGGVYALVAPRSFKGVFDAHHIDLLYLPTLLYSADVRLILEARRRGVAVRGSILSWDNLTAKLQLPFLPDAIAVPSKYFAGDLARYDDCPESRVTAVGYPQYDRYFCKDGILPREEFMQKLGLDPSRPYLLYAMAGPKNMSTDYEILEPLRAQLSRWGNMQVLVRPYPKYIARDYREKSLAEDPAIRFDAHAVSVAEDMWDFNRADVDHLANSIYHADAVLTVGSTIILESAALGRPVINIAFSGRAHDPYYSSPRRYLDYDHVRLIEPGLVSARSFAQLCTAIEDILSGSLPWSEYNARILSFQCGVTDGTSAERLAHFVRSGLL
jgi:hypothetical protein